MVKNPVSFWLEMPQVPSEAKGEVLELLRALEELLPLDPVFEPVGVIIDQEGHLSVGMGARRKPMLRAVK